MSLKEKLTSRLAVKIYIVLSSLFIAVFIIDTVIMPALVHTRSEITVPDVTEKTPDAAIRRLLDLELQPQLHDTVAHPTIAPGLVVYQDPVPGAIVRTKRNVYLSVSGGESTLIMPNLRGRSLRDARITMEQMNLRIGKINYEASELPAETIIAQNISAGKSVRKNQAIEITVSGGSDIEIEIPYVIGFHLDEAQQLLLEGGLRTGTVHYKESSNYLPNTVIGQEPQAGLPARPNSPVDLTVVH
ncbi:MAG: PASTA domain-containing protein [Bacteroidetes bacterium]|nr:PASTA domain-containing protein [Bacteroidota bacterium]